MILHTLVWESRTTPRFIWKASASAEAFSFYAPAPCPFGNNGLRFIPFLPRLSPRALRAGNPRRRDGMKLRQGEPFVRTPGPPSEGLPGGGHDLRKIAPPAGRTGRCVVLFVAGTTCIFPFSPLLSMPFPLCPPGGGKGPVMGALPPFEAPFQTPEAPPLPRAEALCSLPACSNQSFAFGTGGRIHPSPYGGRHEVTTGGLPFVRTPARRRRDCRRAGTT